MRNLSFIGSSSLILLIAGCTAIPSPESSVKPVFDFSTCVKAGGAILRSYPAQCVYGSNRYRAGDSVPTASAQ